ncbi:DEAD/DEAH box helicase [Anditalea andensis]|uniref:RNA helicase n=1 Tax=Anditalea andensis TaxID=1048983 RepID=A0A074KR65_9BACT|nr:DEAD/DEAH box helicase [Anditalea andensis]KEO72446.1 RNA helicase [Anditalea andensis]
MLFSDLGLSGPLVSALDKRSLTQPYPIQEKAIPALLKGRDVLGIAKTGSGKTLSYALPIIELLNKQKRVKSRNIKALVLVPSRELAIQVNEIFKELGRALNPPVLSMAVYGGVSIQPQMKHLYGTEVLVATPGRLLELIGNNAISMEGLLFLVLDEADKMLNVGFSGEMKALLGMIPQKRQTMLFSATLKESLKEINALVLNDPLMVEVEEKAEDVSGISQVAFKTTEERKGVLLRYLIKTREMKQVLVFTSSTKKADNVTTKLNKNGIEALAMHAKKSQNQRLDAINQFKAGKLRVLVATDLASRGLDILALPYVINYELPRSPLEFVHRIGRTGRAEATGEAITLLEDEDMHHWKVIQKKMKRYVEFVDTKDLDLHGY